MDRNRFRRFIEWLSDIQVRAPWTVAGVVLLCTLPAVWAAAGLGLKTDFAELLPENKPSVIEARRVSRKLSSASTLTIVAEGQNTDALKQFVDGAAPRLRALGPEWVGAVDDGVRETRKFFEDHKLLYASLDDIQNLHDEVLSRYDYEVGKATGLGDVGLDEEAPEPLTAESVKRRIKQAEHRSRENDTFPDGYYIGEDGHVIVMMVRTPIEGGSENRAAALRARVDKIVQEVNPQRLDPTMVVRYTGDFITSEEEYKGVKDDLQHVGMWGVGMVLAVVFLFFMRVRSLVAMSLTIGIGLAWSFGAARLTVGHLNSSSGFLVSIIAGNGINFAIIYMARYLEARRLQHLSVFDAVRVAHSETWLGTLAASAAAMVAYGSLAVTDFKGFKHFGVIGGVGMLLCWLATYAALPVILAISERWAPMFADPNAWRSRVHGFYGYIFAWVAERATRPVVVLGVLGGVVGVALSVWYVRADPMEYDLQNLRIDDRGQTTAGVLSTRVDRIVGRMGQDGMAVLADRVDQVQAFKQVLDLKLAEAPENQKPFEKVVTIFDLLPSHQVRKVHLIEEIVDRINRSHAKHFVSEDDWREIEPYLPTGKLETLTIGDLPEAVARPFMENDGTRGRTVYIVPKVGRSIWDAHYLELWANSYRQVKLPNGETVKGSGRAVIFADMIQAVREDAPKAIVVSLVGTLIVVVAAFRFRRASWAVMGTLLLGVSWLGAFLYFKGVKLNFLNFVALPITFGVGADYAVNMMRRFKLEDDAHIRQVIIETGGAVVLCSLTTMVGYAALTFSRNRAIVSFGTTAAVGEATTVVAGVLILPAVMLWLARRGMRQTAFPPSRP